MELGIIHLPICSCAVWFCDRVPEASAQIQAGLLEDT